MVYFEYFNLKRHIVLEPHDDIELEALIDEALNVAKGWNNPVLFRYAGSWVEAQKDWSAKDIKHKCDARQRAQAKAEEKPTEYVYHEGAEYVVTATRWDTDGRLDCWQCGMGGVERHIMVWRPNVEGHGAYVCPRCGIPLLVKSEQGYLHHTERSRDSLPLGSLTRTNAHLEQRIEQAAEKLRGTLELSDYVSPLEDLIEVARLRLIAARKVKAHVKALMEAASR
jgi:hypothetical protein